MSPIGLIDVSSLIRNPERMPTAGSGAAGAGGIAGADPTGMNLGGIGGLGASGTGGVDPSSFAQSLGALSGVSGPGTTPATTQATQAPAITGEPPSFSNILSDAVSEVNAKMQAADAAKQQVLTGETSNVHQAMIAVQESSVAFSLMVEVRNKLVDSYQELMRMQV